MQAAALTVLVAALAAGALWRLPSGPTVCTLKRFTGLACPGCGMTRSVSATLHLDLGTAVRWHLFGPVVVTGAVVLGMLLAGGAVSGRSLLPDPNSRWLALTALGFLAGLILYWIVRLAMGTLP